MSAAADDLVAVARLLVDQPAAVKVDERAIEDGAELLLHVDASERGKVIGRRGRTVEALRALAHHRGAREGRLLDLEIGDD